MSEFLVLRWWVVLVLALAAGLVALSSDFLLERRHPDWSRGRRILLASLVTPALILLGTGLGLAAVLVSASSDPGGFADLAAAALFRLGATGAVIAWLAGLAGAWLAERAGEE